jgi:hypothetical protein
MKAQGSQEEMQQQQQLGAAQQVQEEEARPVCLLCIKKHFIPLNPLV